MLSLFSTLASLLCRSDWSGTAGSLQPPSGTGGQPDWSASQASPTPSASVSTCVALKSTGQLSTASGTPSPSRSSSGVATTTGVTVQVAPGGQSASLRHVAGTGTTV